VTGPRERLRAELPPAMKRRDTALVALLRATLSALGNAAAGRHEDAGRLRREADLLAELTGAR
jgi:hypothetical protein